MASLVSLNFSMPLCAPQSLIRAIPFQQEMHPRKSALGRFWSQTATAANLLYQCVLNRSILPVNRSRDHHITAPSTSRHLCEVVSCLNVDSSACMVVAGYWVGPDIVDDGWGYVEAFVNQIP